MSERLYYTDSYLRDFSARVIETSPDGLVLYLDRTAFYPTSGGQPFDLGTISGIAVTDVSEEEERVAHRVAAPVAMGSVECAIDWRRRFDHMQQHTGQHLLSAVFEELFHLKTVSFHMGADNSTIDLEGGAVDARVLAETERRVNESIWENRPVAVQFEHAAEVQGLRKPSDREGTLRIVSIEGVDRSACGGTHVRATGEIGAVLLRKVEKVRQTSRVEFLCGGRAIRRARADYEALSRTAQLFSAPLDEVPGMVAAAQETARAGDKARRKLELDLAGHQGRELYAATEPGSDGFRRVSRRAERGNLEELRAIAQNFTAHSKAVFVAALQDPASVLLAVSEDAGIDAGKVLKAALSAHGGRGGGTGRIAQGSIGDAGRLDAILAQLG
ncbi:MAG: alanyl-tRNA editing protein [Candidatus Sulfopaludibacter sp.]|nr:alanyl-tRNA editing protein [Candidatus Sulfopaludibacter sp.]